MQINNLGAGLAVRNEPQHGHTSVTTNPKFMHRYLVFWHLQNDMPFVITMLRFSNTPGTICRNQHAAQSMCYVVVACIAFFEAIFWSIFIVLLIFFS